jgi:hypothetical protein
MTNDHLDLPPDSEGMNRDRAEWVAAAAAPFRSHRPHCA